MKNFFLIALSSFIFSFVQAQDLSREQVPSVVLNNFDSQFPKAMDVEWEKKGDLFKVDFETDRHTDHNVWYDASGDLVKHEKDIAKSELPAAVLSLIQTDFKGYNLDDIEMVTTREGTQYEVELDAVFKQEWKVILDEKGGIIRKVAD